MLTEKQVRGITGELRDLKQRYTILVEANANMDAIARVLLDVMSRGEVLSAEGRAVFAERYRQALARTAEALGTTPEELWAPRGD